MRVGSWVGSIGHGVGGVWTFTRGMVSNIYPSEKSRPIFQTQTPLNPGASDGPVSDRTGRVVGVVTTGIVESNSVNFAIRSDVALGALENLCEQLGSRQCGVNNICWHFRHFRSSRRFRPHPPEPQPQANNREPSLSLSRRI